MKGKGKEREKGEREGEGRGRGEESVSRSSCCFFIVSPFLATLPDLHCTTPHPYHHPHHDKVHPHGCLQAQEQG